MRVAIVAPLFAPLVPGEPYGPHAFLVDLARTLQGRDHEVTVYAPAGSHMPDIRIREVAVDPLVGGAMVVPRRGSAGAHTPAAAGTAVSAEVLSALRQAFGDVYVAIDDDGADVISQHAFDAEAFELAGGRPVLHTLHLPPIAPRVVAAARDAVWLATVSAASWRDWRAAGVEVGYVLRNGVPAQEAKPEPDAIEPVALMAGRISPEKGVATGIRAALRAGLRPRVVGEPYDREYFETEVQPLLGSAELIPTVPREQLWRFMARAAVTLLPIAWEEPFGLVAAEAQMAGCPVAGFRRGALPEVVEEGVSGLLVEPGDEDALVWAIGAARRLPRDRVAASARRRLGIDAAVDGYERVLAEIAARAAANRVDRPG